MSRKSAREIAMQIIFSRSLGGEADYDSVLAFSGKRPSEKDRLFAHALSDGTWRCLVQIDECIGTNAIGWQVPNMPVADLCILRVCVYEMIFCEGMPENICINEAVELAKKYGGEKSASFINGVLGSVARNRAAQSREVFS